MTNMKKINYIFITRKCANYHIYLFILNRPELKYLVLNMWALHSVSDTHEIKNGCNQILILFMEKIVYFYYVL